MGPGACAGSLSSASSIHRSQHTPYFFIPSPLGPRCICLQVRAVRTGVGVKEWWVLPYTRRKGDHLGEHPGQQHPIPSPTAGFSHGISRTKMHITFRVTGHLGSPRKKRHKLSKEYSFEEALKRASGKDLQKRHRLLFWETYKKRFHQEKLHILESKDGLWRQKCKRWRKPVDTIGEQA